MFFVAIGRSVNEGDCPGFIFLAQIQLAVRTNERTFAQLIFILPFRGSGFEILAGPAFAFRMSVDEIADFYDTAVMVGHDFIGVDLFGGEFTIRGGNLEEVAAGSVTRGDIHESIGVNRRRDDGGFAFAMSPPEELAIRRGNADDAGSRQLEILPNAVDFGG